MRKTGKVVALVALVAAISAGVAVSLLRGTSGGVLATWLGKQVVGIASAYIEPTIAFKNIDYKAPYALTLHDVTLKAKDGTLVGAVETLNIELAELPSMGKPIQIKSIELQKPVLNLIKSATGFKGLVPFVKATPGKTDQNVDPNFKLSNVLQLRQLKLVNGMVSYDQADGSPKMTMEGLELAMDVKPGGDAGWYAVNTTMGKKPQATIAMDGAVNLDTMLGRFKQLQLGVKVGPDTIQGLPPQAQTFVKEHDATGNLLVTLSGEVPLTDPMQSAADVTVDLTAFNLAFGNFKLPIDSAKFSGRMQSGVFTLAPSKASLLKGTAQAQGTVGVAQAGSPVAMTWSLSNIDLRETLRAQVPSGAAPPYAGIVDAGGNVRTSLDNPTGAIGGGGTMNLRQGHLTGLPMVEQLARASDLLGRVSSTLRMDHSADATYTLEPRGLNLSDFTITTEFIGAKGSGIVGFDESLDLTVAAGPMEKLQGLLGKNQVTKILGDITGSLMKYRVGGVIGNPTVKVDPLGMRGK